MERSSLIRKSSYGRTQLFLQDSSILYREVKCMGGVVRRDGASIYHALPDSRGVVGSCCWHCCEPIDDQAQVIPLPRVYDPGEGVYHVYGRTCSPACAKAYVVEHTTFDRGKHMNTLVKMLREVYGVTGAVSEAPPRPAMTRFGGTFDPRTLPRTTCRLVQPPFVSYCMIVEEHVAYRDATAEYLLPSPPTSSQEMKVEDVDGLDEPPPPALFDEFLRKRDIAQDTGIVVQQKQTRHTPPPSATAPAAKRARVPGPMSKFFK